MYSQQLNNQVIEIEILKEKAIIIDENNYNSFTFLNKEIIYVEKKDKNILVKGLKLGKTILYIFYKNKTDIYIVNVIPPIYKTKIIESSNNIISDLEAYYRILNISNLDFSNVKLPKSIFQHSIFYKNKFFDSKFYINGNFFNSLINFSQIDNLWVNDLKIGIGNDNLFIELFDLNLPFSNLNSFVANSFIRGANLFIKKDSNNLNIFAGIRPEPLYFINKSNNQIYNNNNNNFTYGINYNSEIYENIKLNSSFISNNKSSYLNLGFKTTPINNLLLTSDTSTNFKNFSNLTSLNYNYNWIKTKEFININNEIKIIPKNYSEIFNDGLLSYNLNFRGKHVSDFDISIIKNILFQTKNRYVDTLNILFSKNILKELNLNLGFNNNLTEYMNSNNIQIGLNSNYIIPLSLNCNYDFLNKGYEINLFSNFLNNENINAFFSFVNINKYSYLYNKNINFININLNSYFKLDEYFSFYIRSMYDSFQNSFLLGSNLTYNLFENSKIELEINNPNITKSNYNFSISYTYDFSEKPNKLRNSIFGKVFEDLNENTIIDNNENTVKNVKLVLENNENNKKYEIITNEDGFKFDNIENGNYTIFLEEHSLPEGYKLLSYNKENIYLNNSKIEINFSVTNLIKINGTIFGNKSKTYGLSNVKVILNDNEELYTDLEGRFSFKTFKGNHKVRIDFLSIPNNYILNDSFIKEINLNQDQNIDFIFSPLRVIKGKILKNGKYLSDYLFKYKYINSEKIYTSKTDVQGEFNIKFDEDDDIEIIIEKKKFLINVPEIPKEININFNI